MQAFGGRYKRTSTVLASAWQPSSGPTVIHSDWNTTLSLDKTRTRCGPWASGKQRFHGHSRVSTITADDVGIFDLRSRMYIRVSGKVSRPLEVRQKLDRISRVHPWGLLS